jgi:hypothetical protein
LIEAGGGEDVAEGIQPVLHVGLIALRDARHV